MADKRCFVQFPHPGGEHKPDVHNAIGWNKTRRNKKPNPHKRKFMQFRGKWIDEDGNPHCDSLRAWGEWEPESKLILEFDPKDAGSHHPNYLWKPYWVPRNTYRCLHNTDPFIFGDCFLYSNCHQTNQAGLRNLAQGSVIAFGSGKKIKGHWKWMLDTVLVVKDSFPYDPLNPHKALKDEDAVPDEFLKVTGGPLTNDPKLKESADSGNAQEFRLCRGATPDDPVDEMFSFFPAIPADGESCFPRPSVTLDKCFFTASNILAPKGAGRNLCSDTIRDLWGSLVTQVRKNGLVLGTRADMPQRRAR